MPLPERLPLVRKHNSTNGTRRTTAIQSLAPLPQEQERVHVRGRPPREETIRARAHQIWIERGCVSNDDLGDWLQAEREYRYQWGWDEDERQA